MKLSQSVRRIGNDLIACHLVVTPDGLTLVDAGLAGHWKPLLRELAAQYAPVAAGRGLGVHVHARPCPVRSSSLRSAKSVKSRYAVARDTPVRFTYLSVLRPPTNPPGPASYRRPRALRWAALRSG